jgi:hypothetical protein
LEKYKTIEIESAGPELLYYNNNYSGVMTTTTTLD